jgi:hypothetical protein
VTDSVAALVTNADRDWALAQCPGWARRDMIETDVAEIADDDGWLDRDRSKADLDAPSWDLFVVEQIERFEKFFVHERKTYANWSTLWRKSWWPKAEPERRFPMAAKKAGVQVTHPFFRKGTSEFVRALAVATEAERAMWMRFNVAQFKPDDPRLAMVRVPRSVVGLRAGRDDE